LAGDHLVGKLSAMGKLTRLVRRVAETIKPEDWGYVWLYDCGLKSMSVGLGCGLG